MHGSMVFARLRQCAPHLIHASACGRASLGIPGYVLSPKTSPLAWGDLDPHLIHGSLGPPKSTTQMASQHRNQFSHFCTAHRSVIRHAQDVLSPKNCIFAWGNLEPDLTHSLDPPESKSQMASQSVQPFFYKSSRQRVAILYNGLPFPAYNCPFQWGNLNPHLTHGLLDPPKSSAQTAS